MWRWVVIGAHVPVFRRVELSQLRVRPAARRRTGLLAAELPALSPTSVRRGHAGNL